MVAVGNHTELLRASPLYARLAALQLGTPEPPALEVVAGA